MQIKIRLSFPFVQRTKIILAFCNTELFCGNAWYNSSVLEKWNVRCCWNVCFTIREAKEDAFLTILENYWLLKQYYSTLLSVLPNIPRNICFLTLRYVATPVNIYACFLHLKTRLAYDMNIEKGLKEVLDPEIQKVFSATNAKISWHFYGENSNSNVQFSILFV